MVQRSDILVQGIAVWKVGGIVESDDQKAPVTVPDCEDGLNELRNTLVVSRV